MSLFELEERKPMVRIRRAIEDITYEQIERVCNSYIYLVEDFRDTQIPRTMRREFNDLLKAMKTRKEKWMER